MNPVVVWTFRGERQLHFLLTSLNSGQSQFEVHADLSQRLRMAFPTAVAVVVLDLFYGFTPRPKEYTLLVDVRYPVEGLGGTQVVKLADDDRLRAEFDAWVRTKEPQFNGDGVLMRQTAAYHPQYQHRLVGVLYQDAATHIGLHRQVFLEEAFVASVRHGNPTVPSLLNTFGLLFRSLGRELYGGRQRERPPLTAALELNPDESGRRRSLTRRVGRWAAGGPERSVLDEWEGAGVGVSVGVEAAVKYRTPFADPVAFFRRLSRLLAGGGARVPDFRLTRGPAHGDLHGRNVLVGLEDDRADRPAVYDYEHMGRDNLILYDFVKLETELKLRAYPHLFPLDRDDELPPEPVIRRVQAIEAALATRQGRFAPPAGDPPANGRERRLFALLAGLRERAERTRTVGDGTLREWTAEYLLLLSAYSLYVVRYPQTVFSRTVAFTAAGVAAAAAYELVQAAQNPTGNPGGVP